MKRFSRILRAVSLGLDPLAQRLTLHSSTEGWVIVLIAAALLCIPVGGLCIFGSNGNDANVRLGVGFWLVSFLAFWSMFGCPGADKRARRRTLQNLQSFWRDICSLPTWVRLQMAYCNRSCNSLGLKFDRLKGHVRSVVTTKLQIWRCKANIFYMKHCGSLAALF